MLFFWNIVPPWQYLYNGEGKLKVSVLPLPVMVRPITSLQTWVEEFIDVRPTMHIVCWIYSYYT